LTARTIVHLVDTGGPGGAETIFLELVRGLDPSEWRSLPIVPERDWLDRELRAGGAEPPLLESNGAFDVGFLRALRRTFARERPAVIQTHLFTSAVYATVASAGMGIPVVSTLHGEPDIDPGDRLLGLKLRILSGSRNRLVFVSESLRSHVASLGRVAMERAVVIHNGIDCGLFRPPVVGVSGEGEDDRATVLAGWGLPAGATVVGAVGNVRSSKDYPILLRATRRLLDSGADVHTVIAGQATGELFEELLSLRSELGLEGRVHFVGFLDDVARAVRAFDVFALSSSDEGFSLVTVQAMATGLPVVATRSGGPEEIVQDGVTGRLVPTGDPEALAGAIARVLSSPDRGRAMGAAGRSRATDSFSLDTMIRGYDRLYRDVLGEAHES
jgi:glycosyltransferase involved in cell wall biosynthesis